jgi:hypothetical protein
MPQCPAHLNKIAHNRVGLLGIARPIVEYIAIGRIVADNIRACEAAEEQHPPLERVRYRDGCGGRSDIPDNAEYLIFLIELLHGLGGPRRGKSVVGRDQLEHPAFDAAGVVDPVERSLGPELHLPPKLF